MHVPTRFTAGHWNTLAMGWFFNAWQNQEYKPFVNDTCKLMDIKHENIMTITRIINNIVMNNNNNNNNNRNNIIAIIMFFITMSNIS